MCVRVCACVWIRTVKDRLSDFTSVKLHVLLMIIIFRKFFQDALPMVATGAALRMMGDLLTSDEVKDAQATFWLTSLAFLPNPTKDMVAAVQVCTSNPL